MIDQARRAEDRKPRKFTERLSWFMVIAAALGALLVLIDPFFAFKLGNTEIAFGGKFSADLKGAVISAILIGGWTAVKEYWLGASAGQQAQSDTMGRIAEGVPPNPTKPPEAPHT